MSNRYVTAANIPACTKNDFNCALASSAVISFCPCEIVPIGAVLRSDGLKMGFTGALRTGSGCATAFGCALRAFAASTRQLSEQYFAPFLALKVAPQYSQTCVSFNVLLINAHNFGCKYTHKNARAQINFVKNLLIFS